MKVVPFVSFTFQFKNNTSQKDSYKRLKDFLIDRGWVNVNSNDNFRYIDYHTDIAGICYVLLKDSKKYSLEELADRFFDDLYNTDDIKSVKVIYNRYTGKLVFNNCDKYPNHQTIEISEMKVGDEVVILYRI